MFKFWSLVIEPILRAIGARRLVEIGVDSGACTRHLLEYSAATGGHLDYIDPAPLFEVDAAQARYGAFSTFHRCTSLEALPRLSAADVVLIDGDHNWYTVHRELELLAEKAAETGTGFPLVLFHDVAWPYGRRDLYYAPERVPVAHRQPYAQKGMRPGVTELLDKGGLSAQLCNALREGGPRNGVLTAVEDFVEESKVGTLQVIPILYGLGILVPKRLEGHGALTAELQRWQSESGLKVLLELLERERTVEQTDLQGEIVRLNALHETLARRSEELSKLLQVEHGAVLQQYAESDRLNAKCERLASEAELHRQDRDRLRAELDLIHSSHTWRWTSFVRTASAILAGKEPWHAGNGK